jgi:hypothetical protein
LALREALYGTLPSATQVASLYDVCRPGGDVLPALVEKRGLDRPLVAS